MVVLFLQTPMVNRILIFLSPVNTMYKILPPHGLELELVGRWNVIPMLCSIAGGILQI